MEFKCVKDRTYRYVLHEDIQDYEQLGWLMVADLGDYHGQFSVLAEFICSCGRACVEPRMRGK